MPDIERLSPEEGERLKVTTIGTVKPNPTREALAAGEVIFVAGEPTSLRNGLGVWAKRIDKKLVTRAGERRGMKGRYMWLAER